MRPIERGDIAVKVVDLQVAPLPAARLPDEWPLEAAPVRGPGQAGFGGRRRVPGERTRVDTGAFPVPQLGYPLTGERVERQQGVVLHRAALGRGDDGQVAFRREDRRSYDPLAAEDVSRL